MNVIFVPKSDYLGNNVVEPSPPAPHLLHPERNTDCKSRFDFQDKFIKKYSRSLALRGRRSDKLLLQQFAVSIFKFLMSYLMQATSTVTLEIIYFSRILQKKKKYNK